MKIVNQGEVHYLLDVLQKEFGQAGFEFYFFKIDWYNSCIAPIFRQPYSGDTVAVLIISRPDMFEKTFLPYLKTYYKSLHSLDPIDDCMVSCLSQIKDLFPDLDVELIFDYERHPNRRPKILLQTAAHVSGAAYFYQKRDIIKDALENRNVLNGVCIHPVYGGWFAFRGVAIFRNVQCPNLPQTCPIDVVSSQQDRLRLLTLFSNCSGDWAFRDIIPVEQKYSDLQIKYFSTLPKDRSKLIECWFQ